MDFFLPHSYLVPFAASILVTNKVSLQAAADSPKNILKPGRQHKTAFAEMVRWRKNKLLESLNSQTNYYKLLGIDSGVCFD
jgi:hypothetical protein